jgi:hypothetical protein
MDMFNRKAIPVDQVAVKSLAGLPQHDTIWDLCMTPSDMLYIGACIEHTSGGNAWLCSYDCNQDTITYLANMEDVTGDKVNSGIAPHGKIHFSLCYDNDGIIYGATHCTTAPQGDPVWSPFTMYCDATRYYPGAHLFRHDPRTGETASLGILIPHEGIRVMRLDPERMVFHGTTYPKNHYFTYDLRTRELRDLGRIGNIHQLCLFIDANGNGYSTDHFGRMIRCNADTHELVMLKTQLPHAPFRRGEYNIMLSAVNEPGSTVFYGTTYSMDMRLFRYDTKKDEMTDLGTPYGYSDRPDPMAFHESGINGNTEIFPGGVALGKDGWLYYPIAAPGRDGNAPYEGHLMRLHPLLEEAQDLGILTAGEHTFTGSGCHAKSDSKGNIYIVEDSATPPRFYIYHSKGN